MKRPVLEKSGSFKELSQYMKDMGAYADDLEAENKGMKTRKEAAEYINAMIDNEPDYTLKGGRHHWGMHEFRNIMDFIYDGEPSCKEEKLTNPEPWIIS